MLEFVTLVSLENCNLYWLPILINALGLKELSWEVNVKIFLGKFVHFDQLTLNTHHFRLIWDQNFPNIWNNIWDQKLNQTWQFCHELNCHDQWQISHLDNRFEWKLDLDNFDNWWLSWTIYLPNIVYCHVWFLDDALFLEQSVFAIALLSIYFPGETGNRSSQGFPAKKIFI